MTVTTDTTTATPRQDRLPRPDGVAIAAVADEGTKAAWQRYLHSAPGATVFHDPLWSEAVERTFGHHGVHRVAWRDGRIVGVLPLVEVRSLLGGRMLISVPYGTYGGLLADDENARDALAAEAVHLVHHRGARVLDIRSADAVIPGWEVVERYDAFVRDLPLHPNELDAFLPKRARAAARQARERDGVTVQHDHRLLRTVWDLYSRSMRRLGSISYPYRFLVELAERLGERAWVTVAWHEDRPVAGALSLAYGDTITPYLLGLDEHATCRGAANALFHAVMERAIRSGLRRFDYGRTRKDNPGSAGFKKNQGFEPRTLGYQRYVRPGQVAPDLTPSNRSFGLARRLWPHLPLPVARCLGGWLSRSIPG
ncbi:MAG: GNAT family N-acetyltransferase [Phycisphaerae bacterium]|jgi:FemAB-related protein (PEP-CTERM system-associated)